MCGIFVSLGISKEQAIMALDLQKHRGRDGTGIYYNNGLFLGHQRLSIQDLSENAAQPMFDNEGVNAIVYNGELWNGYEPDFFRIKQEKHVRSNSDTEYILNRYAESSVHVFETLCGMFGIVIYDSKNNKLIIARDSWGVVPLHIYFDGKILCVSSEKKSILACNLDPTKIYWAEPGCYYSVDLSSLAISKNRFYFLNSTEVSRNIDQYPKDIFSLLSKSVSSHMIGDVPSCVIISGGIDSSAVAALAKRVYPDIKAFVAVAEGDPKNGDLDSARLAANSLGIPLTEVIVSKEFLSDPNSIRETIYATESKYFTQNRSATLQIQLAKAIQKEGYKVVLGGELSDELWGSYTFTLKFKSGAEFTQARLDSFYKYANRKNLTRSNKAMMYGGTVELRMPFDDLELLEYAISIPPVYKRYRGKDKPFLRLAFQDLLPQKIVNRPKISWDSADDIVMGSISKSLHNSIYEELFKIKVTKREEYL